MTERELLYYQMTPAEHIVWETFCRTIADKCMLMDTPPMDRKLLERYLMIREPFDFARGYSEQEGYYDLQEGDRGDIYILMHTHSLNEAVSQKLSRIAQDISYQYVLHNEKKIDMINQKKWHYYEEDGPIENGRCSTKVLENDEWEYDAVYDYRKYWFELALSFLAKVFSPEQFALEIKRYEDLLNYHFQDKLWTYDIQKFQFVALEKS